jgi:hypothetical protein
MRDIISEEKDQQLLKQEEEYLKLQKELLEECIMEELETCDSEKISWEKITDKISTLSLSYKKT